MVTVKGGVVTGGATNHTDLLDMPSSTNFDHDARYYTENELGVSGVSTLVTRWLSGVSIISGINAVISGISLVTSSNFVSDVAIGTQPFACVSTTQNNNLNANYLQGNLASAFESTLTKGNLTASSPISLDQTRQVIGGAAVISHDTTAGNIHLPTGGSSNQLLKNSGTSGTGTWGTVTENAGALSGITTIRMSNQLTNTLAIGTTPMVITSTTKVNNLNVDAVDGAHTGTSGGTIPLLNGANTWSANQLISTGTLTGQLLGLETSSGSTGFDSYWRTYLQYTTTTNATQTTLWTYTLANDEIAVINAHVAGVRTDGTVDAAGYNVRGIAYNDSSTTAILGSVNQLVGETASSAGWDATITVSGSAVRVSVTGAAATSIAWSGTIQVETLVGQPGA